MNHKTVDPQATAGDALHEQHHGDLRKGAYLKRRAEYQMQANATRTPQAGLVSPGNKPPGRQTD